MTVRRGVVVVLLSAVVAGCASAGSGSPGSGGSSAAATVVPFFGSASSPVPDPGAKLATTFLARIRDPAARFRLDQTLTVVIGQNSSKAVSHSDVAGADTMVVSDSTVGGKTTHSEYLQSGGTAFERSAGGDWRATGPASARGDPFPFLDATDMRYAGRVVKAGEFLESLSLGQAVQLGTPLAESLGVTGGSASIVVFDAFLQVDGSPVGIQLGLQLTGADGSTAGYGTIVQDYADFGGDVVVEPPVS